MKTRVTGLLAPVFVLAALAAPVSAQQDRASTISSSTRTDTKILYHNGPVMAGTPDVYFIWYGCWQMPGCGDATAQFNSATVQHIVTDFVTYVAGTPYLQINAGYPDGAGSAPSGLVFFGGSTADPYSHGPTLSEADVESVVAGVLKSGALPADPQGIYVVLASSDVTVEDTATHFCLTCCDFHRHSVFNGSEFRYAFVGNPARCPTSCAAQFGGQPSPNGNYAADAMASWVAHAINCVLTNPDGIPPLMANEAIPSSFRLLPFNQPYQRSG